MSEHFLKRHGKKLVIVVVTAAVFSLAGRIWDYFDSTQKGAERFLTSSNDIRARMGNNLVYSRYKSYSFGATGTQPPYREYLYIVKGDKMKARITIRVDMPTEKSGKERYSLVEIRQDD